MEDEPKIVTDYDPPPIPVRDFDWAAHLEDDLSEGMLIGFGRTEAEAIAKLKDKLKDYHAS